jgi:hypothetical protein
MAMISEFLGNSVGCRGDHRADDGRAECLSPKISDHPFVVESDHTRAEAPAWTWLPWGGQPAPQGRQCDMPVAPVEEAKRLIVDE